VIHILYSNILAHMAWATKPLAGLLIDITGVLYESGVGGGWAIPGSCAAIER